MSEMEQAREWVRIVNDDEATRLFVGGQQVDSVPGKCDFSTYAEMWAGRLTAYAEHVRAKDAERIADLERQIHAFRAARDKAYLEVADVKGQNIELERQRDALREKVERLCDLLDPWRTWPTKDMEIRSALAAVREVME